MAVRRVSNLAGYRGPCWRAVPTGREEAVLDGTERGGRYNRPGQRTLYMSGSPAGVAAAMHRYGAADRALVKLEVVADRLIDLRDRAACAALGIDPADAGGDWMTTIDGGTEPSSWRIADRARAVGAMGLIDGSRRSPGEWHLVLFGWNTAGEPGVARSRDEPNAPPSPRT